MSDSRPLPNPENRRNSDASDFLNVPMKNPLSRKSNSFNLDKRQTLASGQASPESQPVANRQNFWLEVAGVLVLIGSMLGYAIYLFWTEPPQPPDPFRADGVPDAAMPSPLLSPLPSLSPLPDQSPQTASKPTLPPDRDVYVRAPASGVYYAETAEYANSRREVISRNGRFCMRLVDAPRIDAIDQQQSTQVTISSLSMRRDGVYIDATNELIELDGSSTEFRDRLGVWQLLEAKVTPTAEMETCLTAQSKYVEKLSAGF